MFALLGLLAVVALAVANPASEHFHSAKFDSYKLALRNEDSPVVEREFLVRVDYFNPQDPRLVNFTYSVNDEFYQPNGPIFIYVGDGGVYTTEWIEQGLVYDIARQTGGLLVTADHRYFGKNIPTETASWQDLQYLTVDQALGDLSVLIASVQRDRQSTSRVILFGSGYGASLAAHARKKFPHLVSGVFASSAYFRAEAIDSSYYDNLSMIIRERGGAECGNRLEQAFDILEYLFQNAEAEYLQERLRLCDPLDTTNPQELGIITFRFVDLIAQYIHFHNLNGLENFCRDLNAIPDDTLNSLIRWIEYAYGGRPECVTARYETLVSAVNQTVWSEFTGRSAVARSVEYIYCTQLGGLKVSSGFALDLFPAELITEEYQYQFCRDVFGEQYDPENLATAVDLLNLSYGGQDQLISHVIFSNAALDPYIHHGIAEYDAEESEVVFLQHDAAGADLRSQSTYDNVSLFQAKTIIRETLTRWALGTPRV